MKIPPEPPPSEEDLFRQAMSGVVPMAGSRREPESGKPIKNIKPVQQGKQPVPVHSSPNPFSDHGASDVPATSFLRPGLNSMTLRKLRRGEWPVQDEIDLHGHTVSHARQNLHQFLLESIRQQKRCVNVIHGKGWQAGGAEGPLKIHVRHWLPQFPGVLAFCEPPVSQGGSGAVWVLLKSG